ncbi:MAG: DUF1524 domain-containing protein [Mycobacterium sp.]|nr:DUF1524 domain-containing protein [Mycobacterium sp.]
MIRRRVLLGAAALTASTVVAGATLLDQHHTSVAAVPPATVEQAADLLAEVTVVDQINDVPGYERGCKKGQACSFGPAWNDPASHTGCDTRNVVLAAQLRDVQFKPGTHNCKVSAGWEIDPYTGQRITLAQTQIDHIYPLHRAYDAGASQWPQARRQHFANDLKNLLAVSAHANESKGDSGLGNWLPANVSERCPYTVRYLAVAVSYGLPITKSDKAAATMACNKNGAP